MTKHNLMLIGISGVSSSGKTTISRLLRDTLPNTFIIHEDDYAKTDDEIPINEAGVADWDCMESIDVNRLHDVLLHVRSEGELPKWHISKEDQNSAGEHGISAAQIDMLKQQHHQISDHGNMRFCVVDGFLLFSENMKKIRDLFDVKIFLRTDYETAKARREARSGYVTLEGFWKDPPGYVENVVWPNYVKDHAFLFQYRDVLGELDQDVCSRLGICAPPTEVQADMLSCLEWVLDAIEQKIAHNGEDQKT